MTKKYKAAAIIMLCVLVCVIFGISYCYASNTEDFSDNSSVNEDFIPMSAEPFDLSALEEMTADISNFNKLKASVVTTSSGQEMLKYSNKYGVFKLNSKDGKVIKYKFDEYDASEKYIVKGTAAFEKKDVNFSGSFIVDNTKTGYKKGQIIMYKGNLTLPNEDTFKGTLLSGKYYDEGTYTWSNGKSFKGKFTKNNTIGITTLGENEASDYGRFYFDSSKKTYLYIRFVDGVPRENGYYYKNGNKYKVKFDSEGKCIYTAKV